MLTWTRVIRYGGGYSIYDEKGNELAFNLSSTDALDEAKEKAGVDNVKLKYMIEEEEGWVEED